MLGKTEEEILDCMHFFFFSFACISISHLVITYLACWEGNQAQSTHYVRRFFSVQYFLHPAESYPFMFNSTQSKHSNILNGKSLNQDKQLPSYFS